MDLVFILKEILLILKDIKLPLELNVGGLKSQYFIFKLSLLTLLASEHLKLNIHSSDLGLKTRNLILREIKFGPEFHSIFLLKISHCPLAVIQVL